MMVMVGGGGGGWVGGNGDDGSHARGCMYNAHSSIRGGEHGTQKRVHCKLSASWQCSRVPEVLCDDACHVVIVALVVLLVGVFCS
jgi:hypothetical protein